MTAGTSLHPDYVAGTWKLDQAHSELSFSVKHLAISKVRGFFRKFDADLVTTPEVEDVDITAEIDMASIDTNNEMRDGHLKTNDFFKVEEFPIATFVAKGIAGTADAFTVAGELTLRGVTKPVTLKGEFGGLNNDAQGNTHLGVALETKLNRSDFGVEWNAPLETGGMLLGEEISLNFELQFVLQK